MRDRRIGAKEMEDMCAEGTCRSGQELLVH